LADELLSYADVRINKVLGAKELIEVVTDNEWDHPGSFARDGERLAQGGRYGCDHNAPHALSEYLGRLKLPAQRHKALHFPVCGEFLIQAARGVRKSPRQCD
jgi:hypothetical protein